MLKKTLLSTLLAVSTLATAEINLNLDLTINNQDQTHHTTGAVIVDQDTTASIVFNGLDALVVDIYTQITDNIADLRVQFFQKTEIDELIAISEVFNVQVPVEETSTITMLDENNGSLILGITPSIIE